MYQCRSILYKASEGLFLSLTSIGPHGLNSNQKFNWVIRPFETLLQRNWFVAFAVNSDDCFRPTSYSRCDSALLFLLWMVSVDLTSISLSKPSNTQASV